MANMVRIEVQVQFGKWNKYTSVANTPTSIKQGLQSALKTQLASKSKKARAVDNKTGALLDITQG